MNKERIRLFKMLDVWNRTSATDGDQSLEVRGNDTLAEDAEYIRKMVGLNSEMAVLDVCCGNGFLTNKLADSAKNVVGIDFSENMVRRGIKTAMQKGLSNVKYAKGYAESLPFGDNSFDCTLCLCALHYLPSEGYAKKVVEEMIRVTRKGGVVFITDLPSRNTLSYRFWQIVRNKEEALEYDVPSITISNKTGKLLNRMKLLFRRISGRKVISDGWLWLTPAFFDQHVQKFQYVKVIKSRKRRRNTLNYRFDVLFSSRL